jgi:hypothetical protein
MEMCMDLKLSEVDVVFCDSMEILNHAFGKGLSQKAKIRTSSPTLLWNDDLNTENVESRWSREGIRTFHQETEEYTTDLYNSVINIPGAQDYGISIARFAINFERMIYKAGCLNSVDFHEPRLFLSVETDEILLNAPWGELLRSNPQFMTIWTKEKHRIKPDPSNPASLWHRLKLGGLDAFLFRSAIKLWKKVPQAMGENQLLVAKENYLIIEAGAQLAKRGVSIKQLALPKQGEPPVQQHDFEKLFETIRPILEKRMSPWLTPEAIAPCIVMFEEEVRNVIVTQDQARYKWKRTLDRITEKKKNIVVSNSPHRPVHIALAQECHRRNIPFIGVQHGVTHEISEDYEFQKAIYETNVSDLFITYNDKMAKIAENNMTGRGKSIAVGLSKRHFEAAAVSSNNRFGCPIAYVSTNLYMGNSGAMINYINDEEKAKQESEYLEIINSIPHRVMYKPYPAFNRRYTDQDPITESAKHMSNITVFTKQTDMRYLLGQFRVIVTTHATSTFSWALFSGKPVVFIDNPDLAPLREEVYPLMKAGIFLFDRRDSDMGVKLKKFLSMPLEQIEKEWKAESKVASRKDLMAGYFTSHQDTLAGKRAADILQEQFSLN